MISVGPEPGQSGHMPRAQTQEGLNFFFLILLLLLLLGFLAVICGLVGFLAVILLLLLLITNYGSVGFLAVICVIQLLNCMKLLKLIIEECLLYITLNSKFECSQQCKQGQISTGNSKIATFGIQIDVRWACLVKGESEEVRK